MAVVVVMVALVGLGWLVAFRVLQAIGGSMLNPVALSIISNTFTDPAERACAIGIWGSVFGVSLALGPVQFTDENLSVVAIDLARISG